LRQFLLSEQSRIEEVLRRLNRSTSRAPTALAVTLTPTSLPNAIALLFLGALALTTLTTTRRSLNVERTGLRMVATIIAALLALPIVFVTRGVVVSSTLLFAVAATTLRAQPLTARTMAIDLVVGGVFALALFLSFTRGLGVVLPGLL
jgi:hypothetical protein